MLLVRKAAQAMLHTNNGGATIEQLITKENLSIFKMPTRAKFYARENPAEQCR